MKNLLVLFSLLAALPATAQLQQVTRFDPARQVKDPLINDLGYPVSSTLSGDRLAIGYPIAQIDGKSKAGCVLILHADTGKLLRVIRESTPDTQANFGTSVAISGNLLAVGAPGYQGDRGAVFVFDLNTGKQRLRIVNDPFLPKDLGRSVAIAGNRLFAGATDESEPGGADQPGAVLTFDATTGNALSILNGNPSEVGDEFGATLALQGRRLAVGAPHATSAAQSKAGAAYLFDWETGDRQARLQASDPTVDDNFGHSLSFARQHLAVTSDKALYAYNTRTFSQTNRLPSPNLFRFLQVACHGMTAYVTVLKGNDIGVGSINLYDLTTGNLLESWIPTVAAFGFGFTTAADQRRLIAASFTEASGPGNITNGSIYRRGPTIASDSLQNLAIVKPQITSIGSGRFERMAQIGSRANGNVGLLARFKNPAPGYKTGAYFSVDGFAAYEGIPLTIKGTDLTIPQIGLADDLRISDITQLRVNHPTQTVFLGTAKSMAGTFPGTIPFIGTIHQTANSFESTTLRRAGNDAAGPGSGKIAAFLDLAQSPGSGFDADIATHVRLQTGVDGITKSSDSAVLLLSTDITLPPTTLAGAKEGSSEPGGGGINYGQINPQVTFSPGLVCFTAFRSTLSSDNQATYSIDRAGNTQRFATRGDLTAAGNIQTLLGITANANNERLVRFTVTGSGVNATNNELMITESGLILRKGAAYPGGPAGLVWKRFLGFHPARASNVIVHGVLKGPQVTAANDGVVTLFESGNPPLTLMREGDLVHGTSGGGARIGSILRVDAQPGDPSGSYLILATLTGVPADSNLAIFTGRSSLGNNVVLTPKLPVLMLRKGQWSRRPSGFPGKLTGIQLPGKNTNTTGFSGTGHLHWQGGDGKVILQLDWNQTESEIVRATW